MKIKKFGDDKIYKGLLSVEAMLDKEGLIEAFVLTRPLWFGRREVLRYWPLVHPVKKEVLRKHRFTLDDLFGRGQDQTSKTVDLRNRKKRRQRRRK